MGLLKNIFGSSADAPRSRNCPAAASPWIARARSSVPPFPPRIRRNCCRTVAKEVLALLHEAHVAQMPLAEVSIHFAVLRITARELRGGAIIFLFPQTALSPISN